MHEIGYARDPNAKINEVNSCFSGMLMKFQMHEIGYARDPNAKRKFLFFFFSSDFQYMLQNLHKTSKIKAIKIA